MKRREKKKQAANSRERERESEDNDVGNKADGKKRGKSVQGRKENNLSD